MTFQRRTPMIQTSQIHHCRKCGASKVLLPGQCHSEERKSEVLQAYLEQPSLQGAEPDLRHPAQHNHRMAKKLLSRPTVSSH